MKQRRLYADHNATTPIIEAAAAAWCSASSLANPGSIHTEGQRARAVVSEARRAVVAALGVTGGEVVFCSGASEANNHVLRGIGPGALVTSALEHASVTAPAALERAAGREVVILPNDRRGRIDLGALRARLVEGGVACVSVTAANNEIGNLNPIPAIAALCAESWTPLHVDAAQVFGRFEWTPPAGVSAVTVSGHKFGAPKGVGAIWLAPGFDVAPLIVGGHQERGARAGTENVPAIHAFGVAVAAVDRAGWRATGPRRDRLEAALVERCGAEVNGDTAARLPNTTNLSFGRVESEELLMALDLEGVAASAGSACFAGSTEPSPVIVALGHDGARERSAIRLSLGPEWTDDDIDDAIERVVRVWERCRNVRATEARG